MKKHILITMLSVLTLIVICLPAFGQEKVQLSMVTGGMGGTFYKVGAGIANFLNSKIKEINITARGSGGSLENIALVEAGKVDLAIIPSAFSYLAREGKPPFKGPLRNPRGIASLYSNAFQGYSLRSKNIVTYADLKGRRVNVGQPGAAFEPIFRGVLETHGLSYKDITVRNVTRQDAMEGIKDGNLDFSIEVGVVPLATLLEMTATQEIRLVQFKEGTRAIYLKEHPEFILDVIPKGSYKGVDRDIETVADLVLLGCREGLSEEIVFKIISLLYSPDAAKDLKPSLQLGAEDLTKKRGLIGMKIPLHPGAERFWKKEGIKK